MTLDIIRVSFVVWALAMGPVATTCGLAPVDGRFGVAGIPKATSGQPTAQDITLYFQGSPAQLDCMTVEVARAQAGGL